MPSADWTTLRELRRTRQRRRLGDVEWFDIAYRAYIVGFAGVVAVVVISDAVKGLLGDDVTAELWAERGPSILGVAAAVAFALGLRSGVEGGPVSIEVADVRHVLLAPVDRRMVMARPISQRLRTVMFGAAVVGAVLAQLVARELDEPRGDWAAAGALFGAVVGAIFVTSAVIAHAIRLPRWAASLVGAAGVVWQCSAAWAVWQGSGAELARLGPADLVGSLALWGVRQRTIDLLPLALTALLVGAAFALGGRLRIEPLLRRGRLVSQLRFAATAQDLRTVVLLRRQLRAEALRSAPWGGAGPAARPDPSPLGPRPTSVHAGAHADTAAAAAVWRRGTSSLRRLPLPRVGRVLALAIAGGAAASLTVSSSPLFALGLLAAVFLLGLEVIEPLAQEIDRPNLTERLPVERGWLFSNHLVAPAALLAVVALFGVVGSAIVEPAHAAAAAALAIPVAFAGAVGPVVAAVRDAPTPIGARRTSLLGGDGENVLVPPEFAGASSVFNALLPIVLSAAGAAPVFAMRASATAGTAARAAVGVALFVTLAVVWIRRRDEWGGRVRAFIAEGQAAR